MSNSGDSRKTFIDLTFNKTNVTAELEKYLLNWTYTDNLSGEIDDFQIQLEDKNNLWLGNWFPSKGSLLKAIIYKKFWKSATVKTNIGKFEIDEIEASGPPTVVSIKASAVPQSSSIRGQTKSKAWEKSTLKVVAGAIAKQNKMKLYYQADDVYKKDRYEQDNETDLAFLYRLCNEEGLCLKIANQSIVILDEYDYEKKPAVITINRLSKEEDEIQVINWAAQSTLTGTYSSCRVQHTDSKKKKTYKATFAPSKAPKVNRALVVKMEVNSAAHAQRLAKKKLREANKNATRVKLVIASQRHLDAGMTINLNGFNKFNGKYIITQAIHSQDSVSINLRKCLEGY